MRESLRLFQVSKKQALTAFSIFLRNRLSFTQPWIQFLTLLVFCFLLFLLGVDRWDLWNPDEPRYAQVAKEMVHGGDWVFIQANGDSYVYKGKWEGKWGDPFKGTCREKVLPPSRSYALLQGSMTTASSDSSDL